MDLSDSGNASFLGVGVNKLVGLAALNWVAEKLRVYLGSWARGCGGCGKLNAFFFKGPFDAAEL